MELATEIRNEADEANDFVVVAKFEEYVAGYQKNMWFIKAIKA
jgi:starvation-inducible DNA-binding protein